MFKIEELTQEQKELLSVYRDKWLAIGLSTDPANRAEAERGVWLAYELARLEKPKVVWCLSPLSAGLTRYALLKIDKLEPASVRDSVRDSVGDSVRASVRASVGDSVWASVWDSVRDSVGDSVRASVRASVGDSVWASVWDSVGDSVRASVGDSVGDSAYGQHDASWLGFYDYFSNVLRLEKQTEKLKGLWIISQNAGWFLPHENICWVSERHDVCKLKNGGIHSEVGPAIHYPDGFSIWALNGVRVPQMLVETPSEKLDAKLILEEKNAEVRREIVRKIGVERVCQKLDAKCISKSVDGMYELLLLDLGDGRNRPYLKMRNPSISTYHIEGVPPEIKTVEQALNWRNGMEGSPLVLT